MDLVRCVCHWVPARLRRSRGSVCLHATSSRIFYYQNQPVVQKTRKVFSFSHVKAKQDQECGGKVCRNTKGSASCFTHVKAKQGLFFSRQSKARPRQAVIAKWQTKQWCKKGKSSARQRSKKQVQRSVPWVSRVEGLTLCEAPRYRFIAWRFPRLPAVDAGTNVL